MGSGLEKEVDPRIEYRDCLRTLGRTYEKEGGGCISTRGPGSRKKRSNGDRRER